MEEKNKRVLIYTFTAANNYGAILQAYALKRHLSICGYDSHCVDYKPSYLVDRFKTISLARAKSEGNNLRCYLKEFFLAPLVMHRNCRFNVFKKNYLSFVEIGYGNKATHIIGSDQVWNYKITSGDTVFFGDIPNAKGKIISYAASMESQIDQAYEAELKLNLKRFDSISVRESSLQEYLKDKLNIVSKLVVDPTLLLDRNEWSTIAEDYHNMTGGYIFLYGFNFSTNALKQAELFAKNKGLKLIKLTTAAKLSAGFRNDVSPGNFVQLIKNADYVITNSFHGTSFSIIFGKRFALLQNHALKKNNRILNLLHIAGLSQTDLNNKEFISDDSFVKLDYYPASLVEAINVSKQYLSDSIEK